MEDLFFLDKQFVVFNLAIVVMHNDEISNSLLHDDHFFATLSL